MESFNSYLDKIKAEESLKDNTKLFLQDKLAEPKKHKALSKQFFFNKASKKRTALLGALASVIIFMSGYLIYQTPVAYVSMDINPSVEVELNILDRVVRMNILNDDGTKMMEGESILNLKSKKAMEILIKKAYEQGYVKSDGSSLVSIMSIARSEKKSVKLSQRLSNNVKVYLKDKEAFVAVYTETSGIESRVEARKMGVSVGKYKLIKTLKRIDPSIDEKYYTNAKISEIILKLGELAEKNEHTERLDETARGMIRRVRATSVEVNKNKERARNQKPKDNPKQGRTQTDTQP